MARRRKTESDFEEINRDNPFDEFVDDEELDDNDEAELEFENKPNQTTRILIIVVIILAILLVGLLLARFILGRNRGTVPVDAVTTPEATTAVFLPSSEDKTTEMPVNGVSEPIVFADTPSPTDIPAQTIETPMPTSTPVAEVEETPLPIILSNTPTPSPSPTPTPTMTPTPTPAPTEEPVLTEGKTNREANLRKTASSTGTVVKQIKAEEQVRIHNAVLDDKLNVWYFLTVNDTGDQGWMRDYCLSLNESVSPQEEEETAAAETLPEGVIALGKTNHDANLRKQMNGSVMATLREGRNVYIYSARKDNSGKLWYEVKSENGNKIGFVLSTLIDLNEGYVIDEPTFGDSAVNDPSRYEDADPGLPDGVVATGKINHDANLRKAKAGTVLTQLRTGRKVNIFSAELDKNGKTWYLVQVANGTTKGYVLSTLVNVDKGMTVPPPEELETENGEEDSLSSVPKENTEMSSASGDTGEPLIDRAIIGTAKTNRAANVRTTPTSNGKLVRQLSKGVEINLLAKFTNNADVWYEIATSSGKTHGFVRDYVITIETLNRDITEQEWTESNQ